MGKIIQFDRFNLTAGFFQKGAESDQKLDVTLLTGSPQAVAQDLTSASKKPWSNQDMASIYRVQHMLDQAGVPVFLDHGFTDEGDPWFVFCREDGDVFAHLCRIDGYYLLDSPTLSAPLRGFNFTDLVDQFVSRSVKRETSPKVVPLRPDDKVFLHPFTMLTALVWTLFLASDDLVGLAPAENDDYLDGSHGLDTLTSNLGQLLTEQHGDQAERAHKAGVADADKAAIVEGRGNHDSFNGHLVQLTYGSAASLTALAISFSLMDNSNSLALDALLAQISGQELTGEITHEAVTHDQVDNVPEVVADVGEEHAPKHGVVANTTAPAEEIQSPENADANAFHVNQIALIEAALSSAGREASAERADPVDNAHHQASAPQSAAQPAPPAAAQNSNIQNSNSSEFVSSLESSDTNAELDVSTLLDLSFSKDLDLSSNLSDLITIALDPMTEVKEILGQDTINTDLGNGTDGSTPEFASYDSNAESFINFLLANRSSIDIIASTHEIIILDTSAFDDYDDVVYAKSWTLEDGGIISTIGNYADFHDYGFV